MFRYDPLDKALGSDYFELAGTKELDDDVFALMSSLIDQNAELMQKVQELNSQKELANTAVRDVLNQEQTIKLLVEMVTKDMTSLIMADAMRKAEMERERTLAEAKAEAEKIIEEKTQFAIEQGLLIINKAQERALLILNEVRKQAEAITRKNNHNVKHR